MSKKPWENLRKTNDFQKSLTRKSEKCQKMTPFREVPTAQKCGKKQYEIKIFVVRDQNMTKQNTHAPDANHDKGLAKTA